MVKAVVTTHYPKSDEDFNGDYYDVEIVVTDPKTLTVVHTQNYGDYYHDKGQEKAEGFIDALKQMWPKVKVTQLRVADREE